MLSSLELEASVGCDGIMFGHMWCGNEAARREKMTVAALTSDKPQYEASGLNTYFKSAPNASKFSFLRFFSGTQ